MSPSNRIESSSIDSLGKLQQLLRDLFQFDLSDLDFGIYRLLRLKMGEIEAFLTEQLPRRVNEVFSGATDEERKKLEEKVDELADRIRKDIDEDALLPTGEVKAEFKDTNVKKAKEIIQKYEETRQQAQAISATEEQKADVFNHLYAFFSRYYEDGDFIPRRRYGSRETYAVPYNGEETYFHWANKNQHYVKTGEHFRDYSFTVEEMGKTYRVRFVLTEASVPPGNTKGDTRYFFSQPDQATFDAEASTFRLPFHYRLPTEEEVEKFGKNSRFQEALLQNELKSILKVVPDQVLRGALNEVVDKSGDSEVTLLLKHLRRFCRRNTTDFFVHKDLEGFLKRELEFYLKDQLLHIADLEADFDSKRRTLRVVRELAGEISQFLAQIENVQKRLFEKRKFVLRTDYLIPIQNMPKILWKDVIANKAQLEEWKKLYALDPKDSFLTQKGKGNEHFLDEHPTLVVNTAHFDKDFTLKALLAFDDIEEATDGLLIHSENYQALRLLQRKYEQKVKCIYIDPPYNTGSDEFIYKDRYQHSSWAAMIAERIALARGFLSSNGVFFSSIDFNEISTLREILEHLFDEKNFEGLITWRRRHNQPNDRTKMIGLVSEYLLSYAKDSPTLKRIGVGKIDLTGKFSNPDNDLRGDWSSKAWKVGSGQSGSRYQIKTPTGRVYEEEWMGDEETFKALLKDKRIIFPNSGDGPPRKKYFKSEREEEGQCATNWWPHDTFGHNASASEWLNCLFGRKNVFDNPKPVELLRGVIQVAGKTVDLAMDFFAGSGPLAEASIVLSRDDGERRKFILIEMANYFDTVILPRVQKVIYAPQWKDGSPVRPATQEEAERTPRLVKVLRLEGYEDALHNLTTEETVQREKSAAKAHKEKLGADTYRLRYLARLPSDASASMLNLEKLEHPFNYTIEVLTEDGPKTETVDLIETFNYLYPVEVQRIETWINEKDNREYRIIKGKNKDSRKVLILWRDMEKLDPKMERGFLEAKLKSEGPFDEMLINGDTATPGFVSLDPIFKRLVEEEER